MKTTPSNHDEVITETTENCCKENCCKENYHNKKCPCCKQCCPAWILAIAILGSILGYFLYNLGYQKGISEAKPNTSMVHSSSSMSMDDMTNMLK